MNTASIIRSLSASLALTGLILTTAGHAAPMHRAHRAQSHASAKSKRQHSTHRAAKPVAALSPLDKLAQVHAARIAVNARNAKPDAKREERDGEAERERESNHPRGMSGGEYYMWLIRAWPHGFIDPTAFDQAIAQRERLPRANIGNTGRSGGLHPHDLFPSATWSFVGPINWYPTSQQAYYGVQSMNGHLESIAVDPTNRLILYVASLSGGVFKSTNGGIAWKSLSDSWLYLRTNAIAINPSNSQIVYAGTGSSPTGFGASIGLMKTTDGGTTWANVGADKDAKGNYLYFAGQNVTRVLVDAKNSNIVTVLIGDTSLYTTGTGAVAVHSPTANIWVSTNGGTTWSKKVADFPFPGMPGFVYSDHGAWADAVITKGGSYLAVGNGPGMPFFNLLYRSADQGATWAQVANAPVSPSDSTSTNGARLAASAVDPNTAYLIYAYNDHLALYKSTDGGQNWTDISMSSGINSMFPAMVTELGQVPYDYYLACSKRTVNGVATDVLYVGLKSVFQQVQTAGNATWTNVGNAFGPNATMHSDQHCIAFDSTNPDRGWFGNDGGIYQFYSNPTDGTTNFLSLNDGLQTTQFYNTSFHPTSSNVMIGGTQDNGTAGAFGDLNAWQMPTGGDACFGAINPSNPLNMYSTYVNGTIYRSDDMFTTKTDISPDMTSNGVGTVVFVTPLAMDPVSPNLVYTAGQRLGQYNSTTSKWTYFSTNLTTLGSYYGHVSLLALSPVANGNTPATSSRIFAATDDGKLLTSGDGGTTWVTLKTGANTDALPTNNVGSVLPDPANANAVYVGLSGVGVNHLYYCPDVTVTTPVWNNLNGAQPATSLPNASLNAIAVDPASASILYVATDVGVFQSPDKGQTWANATSPLSLPNVQVNDLKAMPMQGYLYAGTWGRGIWRIRLRNNDPVSGILFSPERVNGGNPITGTVLLGAVATADTTVTLTSDTPAAASVPSTVTVPQGQSQASFTVTTYPVSFTTPVNITASIGTGAGQTKTASITVLTGTVLPSLSALSWVGYNNPITFGIGGTFNAMGMVTLTRSVSSDTTVNLTSTDPNGAVIPATVVVPAGQTTAQFSIGLMPVSAPETITITAQLGVFKRSISAIRN